jgi:hypothetical protein|nr:hypothetical protein [Neorhizobium tomejilense]
MLLSPVPHSGNEVGGRLSDAHQFISKWNPDWQDKADQGAGLVRRTCTYVEMINTASVSYLQALSVNPRLNLSAYADFVRTAYQCEDRNSVVDDLIEQVSVLLENGEHLLPTEVLELVNAGEMELPFRGSPEAPSYLPVNRGF